MKETNDLIMGIIGGYKTKNLKPFVCSLRRTEYHGKVILFYSNIKPRALKFLKRKNIFLIPIKKEYPLIKGIKSDLTFSTKIPFKDMSYNCLRYFIYFIFLKKYGSYFSNIFLTDIRDVIFQSDPFSYNYEKDLSFFLEKPDKSIIECNINSKWIRNSVGEEALEKIGYNYISCSGTTIGSTVQILNYLEEMVSVLSKIEAIKGFDQGIHNYLLYSNKFDNYSLFENLRGPILTGDRLTLNELNINKKGMIFTSDGKLINVIHQYNRIFGLVDFYFSKYLFFYKYKLHLRKIIIKSSKKIFSPHSRKYLKNKAKKLINALR